MASEDDQAEKSEGRPMVEERGGQATTLPKGHLRHPPGQVQGKQCRHQGVQKLDHPKPQIGQSGFPESSQQICSHELIRKAISDLTTTKFRRSGVSPPRLSFDASLSGRATNAWVVGASTDDVPTLSSLGGVVRSMGATTSALPPGMVRAYSGFWSRRLLCRG
jgi:hypothetical protein